MGCRCKDKRNCTHDISKIEEIKDLFSDAESSNISVSMELQNLAINCMSTFYCINMFELMSEEKKLNEDMTELLPKLINKCQKKIEKLHREYAAMSSEDHYYHHHKHHH